MATITAYSLSTFDNNNLSIAVTGNCKRKIKSKIDSDEGEQSTPIQPKLVKDKCKDQIIGRLMTVVVGLEHMKKIGANSADRTYLWLLDKEVVALVNQTTPLSLIEHLKTMNIDEQIAEALVANIHSLKIELGTRIGYQDMKDKRNRFVDAANQMLAQQSAPKIPEWQDALHKAKKKAEIAQMRSQLEQMESINEEIENAIPNEEK